MRANREIYTRRVHIEEYIQEEHIWGEHTQKNTHKGIHLGEQYRESI